MQEWMNNPLTLYGLVAVGLTLSLALFLTLKLEVGALAHRARREREATEAEAEAARKEAAEMREMLARLEVSLKELEQASCQAPPPPLPRPGINIAQRSQVLRRHRAGEDPAAIAATLGLPLAEVNLLLKIDRLAPAGL
jgi:hypothetical protein